jgi:hypothetical protein
MCERPLDRSAHLSNFRRGLIPQSRWRSGAAFKIRVHVGSRAIETSVLLYASDLLCIIAMQVWQIQILSRDRPGSFLTLKVL